MLGFPIIYFKGMRRMMFQLSGFHCKPCRVLGSLRVDGVGDAETDEARNNEDGWQSQGCLTEVFAAIYPKP